MRSAATATLLAVLAGCSSDADTGRSDDTGSDDTAVDSGGDTGADDTAVDSGGDTAPPPEARGSIVIEACRGETGVDEACTLVTDASACVEAPCDRLVVVFSGGEQGCDSGSGYAGVLAGYAARGYAAVCVNYFETPEGAGAAPYVDEAARLDLAVREATTGAWAAAYWTGSELLLQGISHGATAPVILMARTALEEQAHWRGANFTAGCFFDGSYDQAATASLLATGALGGGACETPVSYQRWLDRYCGPGTTPADCDLAAVPKAVEDTITSVPPAAFGIGDFRLIECGSGLRACLGDIIPAEPIRALCDRLDASPGHTCTYDEQRDIGHLTCHAERYDDCRTWFEALPRR